VCLALLTPEEQSSSNPHRSNVLMKLYLAMVEKVMFLQKNLSGERFTESQNGRGWKGPLWDI